MKKVVALILTVFAVSLAAQANAQSLISRDNDTVAITINFDRGTNPNEGITLYDNETGGSVVSSVSVDGTDFTAVTNKRIKIQELWLAIIPNGLYEVHIYTNNLDPDNDGLAPNPADVINDATGLYNDDDGILSEVDGAGQPWVKLPANFDSLTDAEKDAQLAYSGVIHNTFRWSIVPIKVRSQGVQGKKINELDNGGPGSNDIDPVDGKRDEVLSDGKTIDDGAYSNALNPTFTFIPERENYGGFRNKVASTQLGTDISVRQQLVFGVDLLTAGAGDYSGTIIFEMVSN